MAGWPGYRTDLLKAAKLSTDGAHDVFILDWNFHASSDCNNNPVDISRPMSGATACHRLTSSRVAKRYASQGDGAEAFAGQVRSGQFPHLLAALEAAKPYDAKNPDAVVADLREWGSGKFADYYATQAGGTTGGGNPAGSLPKGHHGFHDLQKALARTLPTHLHRSKVIRTRLLRRLGASRNVR